MSEAWSHPSWEPAAKYGHIGFGILMMVTAVVLLRTLEVFETERTDFADAYLVASAEASGVVDIALFDRTLDCLPSINRVEL